MAAYHGVLLNDVLPAWKGRKLDSIKRADVKLLLAGIRVDRPVHANRTLAVIKRLYSWALDSEIVENSPAIGIKTPKEKSRDRVLCDNELRLVLRAADKLDAPHGPSRSFGGRRLWHFIWGNGKATILRCSGAIAPMD